MSISIQRLLSLFDRSVAQRQPLVLGTVVHTTGPTYTKAGAHTLIAADGEYAGLISGGCLEGDLAEHGRTVQAQGAARLVRYDMRGPDDLLFGLGSGCEGAMEILLQRLDAADDWQPMARLVAAWRREQSETLLLVVRSAAAALPAGAGLFPSDGATFGVRAPAVQAADRTDGSAAQLADLRRLAAALPRQDTSRLINQALPGVDVLVVHQPAPVRILVLGAGSDAQPVVEFAAALGWRVTVVDHRSHFARASRFPGAAAALDGGPAALATELARAPRAPYAAAVVMSHHLASDRAYLQALAHSEIPYLGLLGPASRCERLLTDLGADAARLRDRLHAPVGLDLGAATPEAIALSIVAEIQGTLAGRTVIAPMSALAS